MTFKYSLVSDLHLDHPQPKTPPLEQNVIVAGDCGNGLVGLKYLNKLKRKGHFVFAVDGNHEHYANAAQGRTVEDTETAFELGLEQDMAFEVVSGLWLVGCNGWYCVSDQSYWRSYMNDSRLIGINASQANALALRDAAFVDRMLTEIRGKAIVVTHTAPAMASLDPRFEGQFSNEWYWNPHMEPLLAKHRHKIAVWHHGHTHAATDVVVQGVRIVTNPRGYPRENPDWRPLTMEIET
ncbi:metallophosphoesterase family protein [Sphingopyxis indica]|uniref:metallophosphoesterase n=1 Tax=Sphingopyxis indica TaxID=436663 RepID=UPI0029393F23|nr:metallophosphoesterase family protein [Sphingopyxis indica]WOF44299.1 metallophosphoesterase family protein [Sphingopyxis indica]